MDYSVFNVESTVQGLSSVGYIHPYGTAGSYCSHCHLCFSPPNIDYSAPILGIPIRSNLSDEDTENYAALVSQLAIKAHHVVR